MVFSSDNLPYNLLVGLQNLNPKNLASNYRNSNENKYDYFITNIFNKENSCDHVMEEILTLQKDKNISLKHIIANIQNEINFQENNEKKLKKQIKQQIKFAYHLGLKGVVLNIPQQIDHKQIVYFANMLQNVKQNIKIYLRVELKQNHLDILKQINSIYGSERKLLGVLLNIQPNLEEGYSKLYDRFLTENIEILQLSTKHFVENEKGFPILNKIQESMAKKAYKYNNPNICIQLGEEEKQRNQTKEYRNFVCYLFKCVQSGCRLDQLTSGYDDQLQEPLQPSIDDLEDEVYTAFEQDTPKYDQYTNGLKEVFIQKNQKEYTVFYVGCGRAGILAGLIRAAQETKVIVKVILVEKNKQVLRLLKQVVKGMKNVWVLQSDIRRFQQNFPIEWEGQVDRQADIIVSELLGGFGDNELSPELIYSVYEQDMVKPGGVSIPCSYTSYVAPIYCPLAYHRVMQSKQSQQQHCVKLKRHSLLSTPQPLWTFNHPENSKEYKVPISCDQFKSVSFVINQNNLIQGIGGYFDCELSKEIEISILPGKETKDMLGWFPILFPLEQAVYVQKGWKVELGFWRKSTESKVWYEWQLSVYSADSIQVYHSSIHNANANSLAIYKTT